MDFQGFQNSIPLLTAVSIALVLVALSLYSYQKQKHLSASVKWLLGGMRATSLLLIFLIGLNPFFFSSSLVQKQPKMMVLLDNSSSVTIQKGDYNGVQTYQSLLSTLDFPNFRQAIFDYFEFDEGTRQISSLDSIRFSGSETNLLSAIDQIAELEEDYDAAILISDGIITYGRNPIMLASNLTIPVYTIAVGDTTSVRDVTINNVITNSTGYTNTQQLVNVQIAQQGFANEEATVELKDSEGNTLASSSISFRTETEVKNVEFQLPLVEEGLQQFTVSVAQLPNEWTFQNNSTTFSVDVLDGKMNVLHFAFEVHPDVKMLRSMLRQDPTVALTTRTWLGGNRFVERGELEETYDLIIYHGLPNSASQLNDAFGNTPTLLMELPKSRRITDSFPNLALANNFGGQLFELSITPVVGKNDHPIMELPEVNYDILAPILSSIRVNSTQPDATVLFKSMFQRVETPNPVISVLERGGRRKAHISAWNWYKMYQSNNPQEREFVTQLFANMVGWASNDPDDRRLKINPTKSAFNISDKVVINGLLNNESGEPESSASIELSILPDDGDEKVYSLDNLGSGRYQLTLETLGAGVFSYHAVARKGDRVIDEQSGEFIIENSNAELVRTVRDDALLASLANETGGKTTSYENVANFWNVLTNDNMLQTRTEVLESYHFPVRTFWWFTVVLLLLGAEWIIRKNYSLP